MSIYQVDRAKWAAMSILAQMGNIGSEVGRSFNAQAAGDSKQTNAAMVRALDLLDATAEGLVGKKSGRLKEVLRAREVYLKTLLDKSSKLDKTNLEKYFSHFAIAARRK